MLNKAEALAANRSGQITAEQRRVAGVAGTVAVFLVLLGVAVAGGGSLIYLGGLLLAEGATSGAILIGLTAVVAGAFGLYCLYRIAGAVLTQLDLNEGRIEQAEGRSRWTGMSYAAEWEGRSRWTAGTLGALGPGAYQFYYLPRSGRVLSAAPLPGMARQAEEDLQTVLGRVHGFGEADLALNRHGRMSPRQKRRLTAAALGFGLLGGVAAVFVAFGAWALVDAVGGEDWLSGALMAGMGLILALLMAWLVLQIAGDVAKGSVKQVKGELRLSFRPNGRSTSYFYHIGRETFTVSQAAYSAAAPGKAYRVHYAPRCRRVVGIEVGAA
jgi:hypothetical protein